MNEDFWNARPSLIYIRDYARATRIGPYALLADTLAHVSVVTPPNIQLPPLTGAMPGSLNYYVAVIGEPGAGKGLAEGGARHLVPDLRGAITTQPASGEGLAALFSRRVSIPEDEGGSKSRSRIECANPRALLSLPEIGTLGGVSSRTGSTVVPTLCSAWSGERIGAYNKSEQNRLAAPAHAYRLSMIVGVQPAASSSLFAHANVGLPQRFLYVSTRDAEAPSIQPPLPLGNLGFNPSKMPADPLKPALDAIYETGDIEGSLQYRPTVMPFPQTAYDEADGQRLDVLHGADLPILDAHLIQVKAKTAALLALLDNRLDVSEEDWQLSNEIIKDSCQTRDDCLQRMHEAKQRSKGDDIADDEEAKEFAKQKKLDSARKSVLSQLARHDPAHEGIVGYEIRQLLGRNGQYAYQAIGDLFADEKVDIITKGEDTSNSMWALSSR